MDRLDYLVSSATEKTLVNNSDERLHSVLATLEQCRLVLANGGRRDTAQLVSVAILDLRMKINRIADWELKAMCDVLLTEDPPADGSQEPGSRHGPRRRPMLRLVKS
jgi:hypothetical protein